MVEKQIPVGGKDHADVELDAVSQQIAAELGSKNMKNFLKNKIKIK